MGSHHGIGRSLLLLVAGLLACRSATETRADSRVERPPKQMTGSADEAPVPQAAPGPSQVRYGSRALRDGNFVTDAALSPDGRYLAAAYSRSEEVVVWDLQTKQVASRRRASSDVRQIAWTPDGRQLGGLGHLELELWDATRDEPTPAAAIELALPADTPTVLDLGFLVGDRALVSWLQWNPGARNDNREIWVFDLLSGDRTRRIARNRVGSGRWWASDAHLVVDSPQGLDVYDVKSLKRGGALPQSDHSIYPKGARMLPDGKTFLATYYQHVFIWDLARMSVADNRKIDSLGTLSGCGDVSIDPTGQIGVCGTLEVLRFVSLTNDTVLHSAQFQDHYVEPDDFLWDPRGKFFVDPHLTWAIGDWDPATGQNFTLENGHGAPLVDVGQSTDGSAVFTVDANGMVRAWDTGTGAAKGRWSTKKNPIEDAALHPARTHVALCSLGHVSVWSLKPVERVAKHEERCEHIEWRTDAAIWFQGSDGVHRWRWPDADPEHLVTTGDQSVLAVSADGSFIMTDEGIYDQAGKTVASPVPGVPPAVPDVAIAGRRYAIVDGGDLQLRSLDSPEDVFKADFRRPQDEVWHSAATVAFSSSGALLAIGTTDGRVLVWPTDHKQPLVQSQLHRGEVRVLRFVDDDTLLSGGADTTAVRWRFREAL